ncbi:MAG: DUF1573 domain-containing protein [Taibaiella sp.]|nr:DUF1573 domain-containing protein [Taibaiella sp.]
MKKVFITFLCLSISAAAATAQDLKPGAPVPTPQTAVPTNAPPPPVPAKVNPNAGKFKFTEETHDFGEIPEGPIAEYDFEFKNVGKEPIIINEAHGSCGCTVPKWPQEPILPGKKGVIHVAYTSQGRPGPINKDVTINSNAQQSTMVLHIRGNVKPKPVEAVAPTESKK